MILVEHHPTLPTYVRLLPMRVHDSADFPVGRLAPEGAGVIAYFARPHGGGQPYTGPAVAFELIFGTEPNYRAVVERLRLSHDIANQVFDHWEEITKGHV
jgi:hypothetical protein